MIWYVGAILLLLVALVFKLGLLAYAMYVLLGVLLVSRFLARSWTEQVTADRQCPVHEAEIGEQIHVTLTLRNEGVMPVPWVIAEDLLPKQALKAQLPRLRITDGNRLRAAFLRSKGKSRVAYTLQPQMRGYYQIGPVILEGGDLFGLYRRFRVATAPHFVLVYPRIVPLIGYDLASRRPIGEIRLSLRLYEDPTRISGVREYQRGDPLNRIHWRVTARQGSLHSKIYEPSTVAGASILLEFNRNAYHPRGEPYRSELGVTAAISLANAIYQMGQQVGLVSNGRDAADRYRAEGWNPTLPDGTPLMYFSREAAEEAAQSDGRKRLEPLVVETKRGPEQVQRIREMLARLELAEGLTFAELIYETVPRLPRDATIITILPEATPETAVALGGLVRRGYAVTAILLRMDEDKDTAHFGRLLAEGVEVRNLPDEAAIVTLCQQQMVRWEN
jgi:uncharacterized protein (DUF58 family)